MRISVAVLSTTPPALRARQDLIPVTTVPPVATGRNPFVPPPPDIMSVLITAVPASVQSAMTDPRSPGFLSLFMDFVLGKPPKWFDDLPCSLKLYLIPALPGGCTVTMNENPQIDPPVRTVTVHANPTNTETTAVSNSIGGAAPTVSVPGFPGRSSNHGRSSLSTGAIVGISFAAFFTALLMLAVIFRKRIRRQIIMRSRRRKTNGPAYARGDVNLQPNIQGGTSTGDLRRRLSNPAAA